MVVGDLLPNFSTHTTISLSLIPLNNLSIDLLSQTLSNLHDLLGVRVMVFNVNFNNISAISWQSVLLVEETRVPGENQ
jgi:hypothetical protein